MRWSSTSAIAAQGLLTPDNCQCEFMESILVADSALAKFEDFERDHLGQWIAAISQAKFLK